MGSTPPIEVVSWDVDGTLYDLGRLKRLLWRAALARAYDPRTFLHMRVLGKFVAETDAVRAAGGACDRESWRRHRHRSSAVERRWLGPAIGRAGLRHGVREAIDAITSRGIRQVVVSDFVADYKLDALGITGDFFKVFAGEELGFIKPSPHLFRAVARHLDVSPERILHLGDRDDRDGVAARSAGCRAIIVGTPFPSVADFLP